MKTRKHIIGFAENARRKQGGQGEFLAQMIYALEQSDFNAHVFCREARSEDLCVHEIPFERSFQVHLFKLIRRLPLLSRRLDLLTLLDESQFDLLASRRVCEMDLFDGIMGQSFCLFQKLKKKNVHLVWTALNTHIDFLERVLEEEHKKFNIPSHHFIHRKMKERIYGEMYLADHFRVISKFAKDTFVERGIPQRKIKVIYPAVDHGHFYPTEKRDNVFRVLAVSPIDARKGIYYLLQAFEDARIPNSELVILGGTGDSWSRKMLQGFLSRNANIRMEALNVLAEPVEKSYGRASVVVHAALEDGYGLVIPEALASGRPVIASNQAGASELIKESESGFVLKAGNHNLIREKLQLLANDHSLLTKMTEQAPRSVSHLTYSNYAREVNAFYQECLGSKKS